MLWLKVPQKVYFKKGCMPVALDELGTVINKDRAFIVTDEFLYKNGYVSKVEEKLDFMGIKHTCFYNVQLNPTLSSVSEGAEQMKLFEPDVIIAVGGGSAIDAGKVMWVLYEHPDTDLIELSSKFNNIFVKDEQFPTMGEKADFIAIPTLSGTGSEVSPLAVVTDEKTGIKYSLVNYQLLPYMSVIDIDNVINQPKEITATSGMNSLVNALEAYVSVMATDYTDGFALKAVKKILKYLPLAYENGSKNFVAIENMANSSAMAGIAFGNTFVGICKPMADSICAYFDLSYGLASALLITSVIKYNNNSLKRYCECANFCGFFGGSNEETLSLFIDNIEELKGKIDIKRTIAEYGIKEEDFLAKVDGMSETAFKNQCKCDNFKYPSISDIKEIYLNAYYGK